MRRSTIKLVALLQYAVFASSASGQPLVTGDLSVYYDFDEFVEGRGGLPFVEDESGNRLNGQVITGANDANDDGLADVSVDAQDFVRGAGSIRFDADPAIAQDYVAICKPLEPVLCATPAELIPSTGFTVAAWVKLQQTGTDQAIYQAWSGDGSFVTHAQIQGDGRLRIHLRGQLQSENIVAARVYTDGSEDNADAAVPFGEWFHYAATYDQPGDAWALYYNGRRVAGGPANGLSGNLPLGDWRGGATLGMTPDFGRQLVGKMDEFYVFTRALSPAEVAALADLTEVRDCGDFDRDGDVDVVDRAIQVQGWTGALEAGDPGAVRLFEQGDCDGDGDVDAADQTGTLQSWSSLTSTSGDADLEYDPATGNVTLDASDTDSGLIIGFVLATEENNLLPDDLQLPFFDVGTNTDGEPFQIGQTDPLNIGAGPRVDLGNVLPTQIESVEELADYLILAEYASDLGSGGTLNLVLVPEPSPALQALAALIGICRMARRRRSR